MTLDFHKQFFQTISCGAFLLKDARHYELMRYQAAYLNSDFDEEAGVPNLVSKSLQTTRRFDALKLWMGLEALGKKQYAEADGVTCLKLTLLNPTVCLEDVKVLLASVKATAEQLLNA